LPKFSAIDTSDVESVRTKESNNAQTYLASWLTACHIGHRKILVNDSREQEIVHTSTMRLNPTQIGRGLTENRQEKSQ